MVTFRERGPPGCLRRGNRPRSERRQSHGGRAICRDRAPCAQHMVTPVPDTPLGIHTETWPLVCRLRTSLTPVHTQAWLGARAGPEQMSVSPEQAVTFPDERGHVSTDTGLLCKEHRVAIKTPAIITVAASTDGAPNYMLGPMPSASHESSSFIRDRSQCNPFLAVGETGSESFGNAVNEGQQRIQTQVCPQNRSNT